METPEKSSLSPFPRRCRDDERQADEGGFQELLRAGINPEGMMTFFEKLLAEEQKDSGGQSISWFATHPGTQDRVADILIVAFPIGEDARGEMNAGALAVLMAAIDVVSLRIEQHTHAVEVADPLSVDVGSIDVISGEIAENADSP